jgi:hypothetical protein
MKIFKIRTNLRFFNVILFLSRGGREKGGIQIVVNLKDKFMEVSFSEILHVANTNRVLLTSLLSC